MRVMVLLHFLPAFLLACCLVHGIGYAAAADPSSNIITVEAKGVGKTRMEALRGAWQEAVRTAVGMYMTSKTQVLNDDITEEIAAYSRGQIDSFRTLSERQIDGMWHVTISANVEKDIIQEALQAKSSQAIAIDGEELAAKMQSANDRAKDAQDLFDPASIFDFADCLDYQLHLQNYKYDGKIYIYAQHVLRMNLDKYQKRAGELEKLLAQLSVATAPVAIGSDLAREAVRSLSAKNYAIELNPEVMKVWHPQSQNRPDKNQYFAFRDNGYAYFANVSDNGTYGSYSEIDPLFTVSGNLPRYGVFTYRAADVKTPSESVCIAKNVGSGICYVAPKIRQKLKTIYPSYPGPIWEIRFAVSSGDGFDALNEVAPPLQFRFSGAGSVCTDEAIFISPNLYVGGGIMNAVPAVVVFQQLDVTPEQLASLKSLKGSYTISLAKN